MSSPIASFDAFPRCRTVQAAGCETFVAEAGAGAGAPIVLLHGNPDTHDVWSGVVAKLATSHRCIAPDMPGFGKSKITDDFSFTLDHQAAFVGALLDALELPKVHLVVHDVGGPYGLAFVANHPERLQSLTIFNTNFFPDYHWHFWARVWRTRILGEIAMAIAFRWLFVHEMRRGSPRLPLDYASHAYDEFGCDAKHQVLRWYRAMDPSVHEGWDTQLLAAIARMPRQVLWGDLDPFLPSTLADRYGGTVDHVANAGHWLMQEEPEFSANAIARLVDANR